MCSSVYIQTCPNCQHIKSHFQLQSPKCITWQEDTQGNQKGIIMCLFNLNTMLNTSFIMNQSFKSKENINNIFTITKQAQGYNALAYNIRIYVFSLFLLAQVESIQSYFISAMFPISYCELCKASR